MDKALPHFDGAEVHVISHQEGASFDTFAYNSVSHDSVYYAYDPHQPYGRRALSSATDGNHDHTVSLFEDGTATVGASLRMIGGSIIGSAVTIGPGGELRILVDGKLAIETTLSQDPQLDALVAGGYIDQHAAKDLLNAFHWSDLTHLECVRRGFPTTRVGTDGASYHVPPHIVQELDTLIIEAGATSRPMLPLLIMPILINR